MTDKGRDQVWLAEGEALYQHGRYWSSLASVVGRTTPYPQDRPSWHGQESPGAAASLEGRGAARSSARPRRTG